MKSSRDIIGYPLNVAEESSVAVNVTFFAASFCIVLINSQVPERKLNLYQYQLNSKDRIVTATFLSEI